METIKVNMSPNPLDVQTIHASQNDTEARQWEFELHNNGELIDTSEITEQLFFKAYKGGTEQLLPENGSTPTTSPFKGDIRYPQGLLTDQEFTYRQSPTEEDGLAKITDIKGNTLVWNQLLREISSTYYASNNSSTHYSDGNVTLTATSTSYIGLYIKSGYRLTKAGHKYLYTVKVTSSRSGNIYIGTSADGETISVSTSPTTIYSIKTATVDGSPSTVRKIPDVEVGDTLLIENFMCFDLTQMGLDITDPSDFTSLFSLPYYAYNQGSLLSFMGNGLKTVGFNQWDEEWEKGTINTSNGTNVVNANNIRSTNYIKCLPNTQYYFRRNGVAGNVFEYDADKNFIDVISSPSTFTTKNNTRYLRFYMGSAYGTTYNNDICINISSDKNGTYEPYTSSTLSLPISTYFPNGMKSAGSVYDELTESKAITRIGMVDLGSLNYNYAVSSGVSYFFSTAVPIPAQPVGEMSNLKCSLYTPKTVRNTIGEGLTEDMTMVVSATGLACFRNDNITSASAFKTAMSGVYLYYELATYNETEFTTASLVTENTEIPLSNEDGTLIGKCTEQLSSESGFFDAKIKLSDEDGDVYSSKIQIHVERSPQ